MQPSPIQVDIDSQDERLDPMSRLHLGGVTTVEHNIKVKALGKVNKRFLEALRTQYNNVQNSHSGAGPATTRADYALRSRREEDDGDEEEDEESDDEEEDDDEEA